MALSGHWHCVMARQAGKEFVDSVCPECLSAVYLRLHFVTKQPLSLIVP